MTEIRQTTIWAIVCCTVLLICAGLPAAAPAAVEGRVHQTLQLKQKPLDMVVSAQGNWIFVLTEAGRIEVYSPGGVLSGSVAVGADVDRIAAGPREDLLLLQSSRNQTIQILVLEFIRAIETEGSPFKGTADAPVTIAVFSDFQ